MKFFPYLLLPSLLLLHSACGQPQESIQGTHSTPQGFSKNKRHQIIRKLKPQIVKASQDTRLRKDLIASVLNDELKRRSIIDDRQDAVVRQALQQGRGQLNGVPRSPQQSLWDVSFGYAQMKPNVVVNLYDTKHLFRAPKGFKRDDLYQSLQMLVDEKYAPLLIAYRLRQIRDMWLKNTRKQNCAIDFFTLKNGSNILATLYSIGITGKSGFHCQPKASQRGNKIVKNHKQMRKLLGLD